MKKILFSLIALSAIMASCSKSETLEYPNQDKAIAFDPYSGRIPVSKAPSLTIDSLGYHGFQVYGFLHAENATAISYENPYMDKVVNKRSKTGDNGSTETYWGYDGVLYWPGTMQLDFVAYALNNPDNVTETDNKTISISIPDEVSEQDDLLVATPSKNQTYNSNAENNGVVALDFKHLLSRISFSLKTKDGNDVPVTLEEVKISGSFYKTGTVDLTAEAPSIVATTPETTEYNVLGKNGSFTSTGSTTGEAVYNNSMLYEKSYGENQTQDNNSDKSDDEYVAKTTTEQLTAQATKNSNERYMMIIPSSTHNAKLYVKYFLPYAGTYDADVNGIDLSKINFEAGKSYNFVLSVSTNKIEFDVTVSDWTEGTITDEIKLN